jgi:hypothetical protein
VRPRRQKFSSPYDLYPVVAASSSRLSFVDSSRSLLVPASPNLTRSLLLPTSPISRCSLSSSLTLRGLGAAGRHGLARLLLRRGGGVASSAPEAPENRGGRRIRWSSSGASCSMRTRHCFSVLIGDTFPPPASTAYAALSLLFFTAMEAGGHRPGAAGRRVPTPLPSQQQSPPARSSRSPQRAMEAGGIIRTDEQ